MFRQTFRIDTNCDSRYTPVNKFSACRSVYYAPGIIPCLMNSFVVLCENFYEDSAIEITSEFDAYAPALLML